MDAGVLQALDWTGCVMTAACLPSHSRTLAPEHYTESLNKALALRNDNFVCRKSLVFDLK